MFLLDSGTRSLIKLSIKLRDPEPGKDLGGDFKYEDLAPRISGGWMRRVRLFNLIGSGRLVDFTLAWRYQRALLEEMHVLRKTGSDFSEAVLLLEHDHVYTLGRAADEANVLSEQLRGSSSLVRVERGGEVTYHGPGQLVVYPLLDLNRHKRDLHWYVRSLEEAVIGVLAEYGVPGERSEVNSGVWVGKRKLCAVGVTASRWLTMHGLAVNVNCDLSKFENIVPCGISDPERGVTSLREVMGSDLVVVGDVAERLQRHLTKVFRHDHVISADESELATLLGQTPAVPKEVLLEAR